MFITFYHVNLVIFKSGQRADNVRGLGRKSGFDSGRRRVKINAALASE
jgi:hypothetical protein